MKPEYPREMWENRYGMDTYAYGTNPNDFLVSVVDRIPPGRVLCLAEGEGRNAVYLAEKGFDVVGVDASPSGLEKAQRLAQSRGVTIKTIIADLSEFEIEPQQWNGIVSIFAHLPPAIRARIHQQAVQGLLPNGVFVLEAYTPAQLAFGTGGPSTAEMTMPIEILREELPGLQFAIAHEIEREVQEGQFHNGRSAVVQILAYRI